MRSLESKDMPLRTRQEFYQPSGRESQREGIKIFPEKRGNSQHVISPSHNSQFPSVFNYLSGLNEAKNIPRIVGNKHEYYPFIKKCKRHQRLGLIKQRKIQNEQQQSQQKKSRFQTLVSSNPTNRSMMMFTHIADQQRKIDGDRRQFRQTNSLGKQQKQKQMRFSFYNTIQKSNFFLKRFHQDKYIEQRKTNNYQNMISRNITVQNILNGLKKSRQKYKIRK